MTSRKGDVYEEIRKGFSLRFGNSVYFDIHAISMRKQKRHSLRE